MKFERGDAVFHPVRGAGVVARIEERRRDGDRKSYYRIKLVSQPGTILMIPTSAVKALGLRRAISQTKLKRLWRVLSADPEKLPVDHKERYQLLQEKLHGGDALELAKAVRDMTWRQEQEGRLTTRGKRMYDEGMLLLAGEVAAVEGVDLADAEAELKARLRESISPSIAV